MKHGRIILTWALTAAMCVGLMSGCGGSTSSSSAKSSSSAAASSSTATASSSAASATSDKIARFQVSTVVDSMDVCLSNDGTSCNILAQCMMGLYTKDANGTPVLGVAKSVDKSADGLTYTFTLRDDAKWSNGDAVTAKDFVFEWQRLADPNTASAYQFFVQTACLLNADDVVDGKKAPSELGVKAQDDKTLVVTLSSPCAVFESLMTSTCFMPVEQSFFDSCGATYATSPATINCDGPFKVTAYEPSTMTIELVKNPNFYGASSVKLDGVEFQVILDSQTAALSYESGKLDQVVLTGNLIEQYSDDPAYSTRSDGYIWYIAPNMDKQGLNNLNIREAMAKAFDKKAICESILKDGSTPMDYYIPAGLASDSSGQDFRAAAGSSYDTWTYDVTAARELWQKGLQELGVTSLSYTLLCDDTESCQAVAQFLQSEWQKNLPGLTITLQVEPKKARLADMQKGNFDIGLTRWGPDYADPMTDMDLWTSDSITNYSNFNDAEYDATIKSAKSGTLALDLNARWKALIGCEKKLASNCVLYPIYGQSVATLTNAALKGVQFYSIGAQYLFLNAQKN